MAWGRAPPAPPPRAAAYRKAAGTRPATARPGGATVTRW
jgi:hypothetical protein